MREIAFRAMGDLLLGVALGLLAYYGVTNAFSVMEQRVLRDDLGRLGAVAAANPEKFVEDGDTSGFESIWDSWTEEDGAYWNALPDGGVFGRLIIERMDLDVVVIKGHSPANLKRGPAWIDYTDLPGGTGNVGVSGHRTTYGAPFRRLDELVPGDLIEFYSPYRLYRYRVTESFQVTPDRVDVVASTEQPRLTLTACDPPFSARYRLIVWSDLEDVRLLGKLESPELSE